MRKIINLIAVILLILSVASPPAFAGVSPDGIWEEISPASRTTQAGTPSTKEPWIKPDVFRLFTLDENALTAVLGQAPAQDSASSRSTLSSVQITLPMPDGTFAAVAFADDPLMAPELAAKFPETKTYMGYLVDNPSVSVAFDKTSAGFHAQVLAPEGTWYIDPYIAGESYASYYKRDYRPDKGFTDHPALQPEGRLETTGRTTLASPLPAGDKIRKYRLAVACTGEYAQFHCGTNGVPASCGTDKTKPHDAIVTTFNRVRQIYKRELAIDLELVANNDDLIYLDPTNELSNGDANELIKQSQTVIDSVIRDENYDIGHTISTGGGGLSYLGIPCWSGWKARAVTGSSSPKGDGYDVDYVCHEMGHQFNANHTFNGRLGGCLFKHFASSVAYEPGSGSTIMAYDGLCGADNIQNYSDPMFHAGNFDEIQNYVAREGACYTSAGSLTPITVQAGADETIPVNTPFMLTGTASGGGGTLTYDWEEYDRSGVQAALTDPDDGRMPLFRVYPPSASQTRVFPKMATLAAGITDKTERLPQVGRTMNFRLIVRDGVGGIAYGNRKITVDGNSRPFRVTEPAAGASVSGTINVEWDKANTDAAPVNAANVAIYLSTDGGYTFDMQKPLTASTLNNGSAEVTLPNINTANARIMVKAVDNAFFAISGGNFTITGTGGAFSVSPSYDLQASGDQGGPFQNASIDYKLQNTGTAAISWTATKTQPWVTLSSTEGTLNAGASIILKVSLNENAEEFKNLLRDSYQDTVSVTFKNENNVIVGSTVRLVNLKVGMAVNNALSVLEPDGFTAWGLTGGPFTPATKDFTLRNIGSADVAWTAAKTQNWLTLTPLSGTLTPGASATVTATINESAKGLSAENYSDTITFANTTNKVGNTTRPVALTVYALTDQGVDVIPASVALSGCPGGPYAPSSGDYMLRNLGNSAVNWTAAKTQGWLTLSATTGTLLPGTTAKVTVAVSSTGAPSVADTYNDTITFTYGTGSATATRPVQLQINQATGALAVTPYGAYLASGVAGGAVAPAYFDYTLQNSGCASIDWEAVSSSAWITPPPSSGPLAAGDATSVRFTVNDRRTKLLSPDFYTTALYFLNKTGKNAIGRTLGLSLAARGDVNGDGRVDLSDAVLALQAVSGQAATGIRSDYAVSGVDVNGDNKVGLAESEHALQTTAALRPGNFSLKSSVMTAGQRMPDDYTDAGAVGTRKGSPPLNWLNPPAGTKSFVLIVENPDDIPYSSPLSSDPWNYWIVYDLPATATSLAADAGAAGGTNLPTGAKQGMNASGTNQYIGPSPAKFTGMNRYFFRLFALSDTIGLQEGAARKDIEKAMAGKILGQCELMVTYSNTTPPSS